MNMVLEKSGRRGTGSNMANSFANYGSRVSGPQVGAIAVMSRGKRGGHVGIVSGLEGKSDCDFRQLQPPCRRVGNSARPYLRLRDALIVLR